MTKLVGKLRWYPGDALVEIKREDLEKLARKQGVSISLQEVKGVDFVTEGEVVYEDTMNHTLEEVTQIVVTISANSEPPFQEAVRQVIDKYRAPRTPYAIWGSDERAKEIIAELADERDGWF